MSKQKRKSSNKPVTNQRGTKMNYASTQSKYMLTPELGRLATAVNMMTPNGVDCRFADGVNLPLASAAVNREPGCAENRIMLIPGGTSNTTTSTINEACRAMFVYIRNRLMKNITRYEKTDLLKMLYAMANIFAWAEYLKRVLRVIKKYNVLNKYTPIAILKAMHINTVNIDQLAIDLEYYIERLQWRIQNLVVPRIPLFTEVVEAFQNVYVDEDIAKAQYIVDVPVYIWKYTVDQTTSKGKLVPKMFVSQALYSYTDLVNFTEDLLSEISNDEDFAFLSGDILAAYDGQIYKMPTDVDTSIIDFKYDPKYLEKWHNSCAFEFVPTSTEISSWEITEATSASSDPYLVFDPEITCQNSVEFTDYRRTAGNRILDFYDREVSSDRIMEASRWMFSTDVIDVANKKLKIRTCGSQIVQSTVMHYYDASGTLTSTTVFGGISLIQTAATTFTIDLNNLRRIHLLSKWNYCPMLVITSATSVSGLQSGYVALIGDLGNYTVLDPQILANMNTLANYTLLGVTELLAGK